MRTKVRGQVEFSLKALRRPKLRCSLLVLLVLFTQAGFGTTSEVDIKAIVVGQCDAVRARHPDAKLFQVFVHNLVPEQKPSEQSSSVEIHSSFQVSKAQDFLEVISKGSREMQEVVRPFTGNDCFHGYPSSRSEACSPIVEPPITQDEYLGLDWSLEPAKLAAALRKCVLDPSKHFDITIVTAARVVSSWNWSDVQVASTTRERLSRQNPKEAVISASERSASGHAAGPTCLFTGVNYEYLGNLVLAQPAKLPPTR
jgi:hypothetical protein